MLLNRIDLNVEFSIGEITFDRTFIIKIIHSSKMK